MPPKITVIGSANIDYVMQMERLPNKGETVAAQHFTQAFGGKGANQAVAAARAGAEVALIACLGNDPLADGYRKSLTADKIDCTHLNSAADVATGSALIMLDTQGDNYLSITEGANAQCTPEQINAAKDQLIASDWIILQQEIPVASNQAVLAIAAEHKIPVLLNYAPATDLGLTLDDAIHGLVVNETEAMELLEQDFEITSAADCARVAETLRTRGGHRFVALTLGGHGVTTATAERSTHHAALKVDAIDTTAAGDTFCGALAVALGEGNTLEAGVRFATAAAALAVTKLGAQPSIPDRDAIDALLN